MATDVWTAFLQGMSAFGQTRAARLVATSLKDTGPFILSLRDGAGDDNTRNALDRLKADIDALKPDVKAVGDAIKADCAAAAQAVSDAAAEIAKPSFNSANAAAVAVHLGAVLAAFDRALQKTAKAAARNEPSPRREALEAAIGGITAPLKKPFQELGTRFTGDFDKAARQLFGVQNATGRMAGTASFDRAAMRLELKLVQVGQVVPGGLPDKAKSLISLDGVTLVAFLAFQDRWNLGLTVRTALKAGLRGIPLLSKVIPHGAPSTDASSTAVTLDTDDGLTFGDKKSKSLILPVRFAYAGVELRELALVLAETGGPRGEVQLRATVAGKLGEVIGAVVEGGGITVKTDGYRIEPRLPDAVGLRIDVGVLKGGGYIRQADDLNGLRGALELRLGSFGVTAFTLLTVDSFSLVVVLGIVFRPKIELGLGFTLSGVGGLLALNRSADTDELRNGIRDGTASLLLFPDDPIQSAPKILDKLSKVFPAAPAGEHPLVVGPMLQLGWGSQAGFVLAKLAVLIVLPDPKILLLGSVDVGVPSAEVKPELRIIDLHAEVYGEVDPQYVLLRMALTRSRLGTIPITGDLGLYIRWAGEPTFALSVGGFHPRYANVPKELADLRRIAIDLSPSALDWVKITVKGYAALTASSLQWGGGIWLYAEVGPATGEAWLEIDTLFVWSPRFYFEAQIEGGLSGKAFDVTFVGAHLIGVLKGTTPWSIEASARISMDWLPDVDFDIGPFEWGEKDSSVAPSTLRPRDVVAAAMRQPTSWSAELPADADRVVRLQGESADHVLVHPLGVLSVSQQQVPLSVPIDRIGQSPVAPNQVGVRPVAGSGTLYVTEVEAPLPPGHFFNLPMDQQLALPDFDTYPVGVKFAAANAPVSGTPLGAAYAWETCFPQEAFARRRQGFGFSGGFAAMALANNAVSAAVRRRVNPYVDPDPDPLQLAQSPRFELRSGDDLTPSGGARGLGASLAWRARSNAAGVPDIHIQMVAEGIAA